MAESKPIKVCLTNKGEDTETPWAHDLGPAPASAPAGSRLVKLVNVPFMHAKPTWGDVIVVSPVRDAQLTWDRDGTPWKQIGSRIVEDGGRWAMIVDYAPRTGADVNEAFRALTRACEGQRVVCEGAWAPREGEPGRAYFAVPKELSAEKLMDILRASTLPLDLILIHPEPKARPAAAANGAGRKVKAGAVPVEKLAEPAAEAAPKTRAPAAKPATGKAVSAPAAKPAPVAKAALAKAAPAAKSPAKAAPAKAAPAKAVKTQPAAKPQAKAAPAKATAKAAPAKVAAKPAPAKAAVKPAGKAATKAPAKKAAPAKKPAKKK